MPQETQDADHYILFLPPKAVVCFVFRLVDFGFVEKVEMPTAQAG